MSQKEVLLARAESFTAALDELCRTHRFRLEHEDNQGRFTLTEAREGGFDGAISLFTSDGKNFYL